MNVPNDPAAILYIPVEEDIPIIRRTLQEAFTGIELAYMLANSDSKTPADIAVLREGSLYQELLAQLNQQ